MSKLASSDHITDELVAWIYEFPWPTTNGREWRIVVSVERLQSKAIRNLRPLYADEMEPT